MKPEKAAEALGITLKVVRTLVVRKILHTYDVWREFDMWGKRDDVVDLQEKLGGDPSYQKTIEVLLPVSNYLISSLNIFAPNLKISDN